MRYYKIALWEAYFNKGFSKLNVVKYLIAIIGFDALLKGVSVGYVILAAIAYCFICLLVGKFLFHINYADAEHEVQNKINPFVREMRKKLKVTKSI